VRTRIIVLISMMLFAFIGVDAFAENRLVRVAGDPYPPWTEGETGTKAAGGIAVEIVEELFERLGMEARVLVYPFSRGLEQIEHGEEDVILMVSKSKEREQFMAFSHPIREVRFVFYHSSELDSFEWGNWKDLKPYRIGSVTGYNMGDEWKEAITEYDLQVEEVKTDIFNLQKLLLGRIDLVVTDDEVMQRLIEMNPDSQGKLSKNNKPVFESVNNLGISRKSFLLPMLPRINQVLQQMKGDGTFQKIFCKYGKIYRGSCESS